MVDTCRCSLYINQSGWLLLGQVVGGGLSGSEEGFGVYYMYVLLHVVSRPLMHPRSLHRPGDVNTALAVLTTYVVLCP